MRPACFAPLVTDTENTYKWIKCHDVWGEVYEYSNVTQLQEYDDGYTFFHSTNHMWWPTSILVRVEYGPIVYGLG